ncbi:MAG: hypothetical protein EON58_09145, partial [Alphaproteobacteria bacterium]
MKILVADNLEREGEAALSAGLKLANELHAESLTHMHVQDMSYSEVDRMIRLATNQTVSSAGLKNLRLLTRIAQKLNPRFREV